MESNWFKDLGWWKQKEAYALFDKYRENPINGNLNHAIEAAIPIIRVVFSSQKVRVLHPGDEDDLISAAALTITKALPKMANKPRSKIGDDKQYMRYLFTCVIHSFYRELDVLHGKSNKIQKRLDEVGPKALKKAVQIHEIEAKIMVANLPKYVIGTAMSYSRLPPEDTQICEYIMQQLIYGREMSKAVLGILGCKDKKFYISYAAYLLRAAFLNIRKSHTAMDVLEDATLDSNCSTLLDGSYEEDVDYAFSDLEPDLGEEL